MILVHRATVWFSGTPEMVVSPKIILEMVEAKRVTKRPTKLPSQGHKQAINVENINWNRVRSVILVSAKDIYRRLGHCGIFRNHIRHCCDNETQIGG